MRSYNRSVIRDIVQHRSDPELCDICPRSRAPGGRCHVYTLTKGLNRASACSVSDCTLCSASPATQASMGDCGPWDGAGEELLGATLRHRLPQAQPGPRAPGRDGSCPAQRDQATSTADLPGRGP